MRSASSCQKLMSPTADLMPTGRPVSAASSSTQSSRLSVSANSAWRDGLMQSSPHRRRRGRRRSRPRPWPPGSSPPRPGLAPWLSLTSRARTGAAGHQVLEPGEVEAALLVPAAEVGGADLEDELAAVAVVGRQAALAGVLEAAGQRGAPVERLDGVARQRAEAHARDVHHRVRAGTPPGRPRAAPSTLAQGTHASWPACGIGRRGRPPERGVLHDRVAGRVLDVVVGPEAEVVVLQLGRGVDPAALVPAERPLLVVAGDDVLAQLGPDRLDQVAGVADDREVAQQRVPALQQVVGGDRRHRDERSYAGDPPLPDDTAPCSQPPCGGVTTSPGAPGSASRRCRPAGPGPPR